MNHEEDKEVRASIRLTMYNDSSCNLNVEGIGGDISALIAEMILQQPDFLHVVNLAIKMQEEIVVEREKNSKLN